MLKVFSVQVHRRLVAGATFVLQENTSDDLAVMGLEACPPFRAIYDSDLTHQGLAQAFEVFQGLLRRQRALEAAERDRAVEEAEAAQNQAKRDVIRRETMAVQRKEHAEAARRRVRPHQWAARAIVAARSAWARSISA